MYRLLKKTARELGSMVEEVGLGLSRERGGRSNIWWLNREKDMTKLTLGL